MANVSVANTPGLYIGSGAASILTSAQQLDSLLANSASVGFYLTNSNAQVAGTVLASGVTAGTYGNATIVPQITIGTDGRVTGVANITISGGGAGSYGNANVAAYLPTDPNINAIWSNISLTNANISAANVNITTLFANAATQETEISGLRANITAANATISATNANVTAANAAIVTVQNNLNAFETYANATFGTSNYGNANVAGYLPTYTGNLTAGNVVIAGNLTVQGNTTTINYNEYVAGQIVANATTPSTSTTTGAIISDGGLGVAGNIYAGAIYTAGNISAGNVNSTNGYFWGNGSVYGVTRVIAGGNVVISPVSGVGDVTITALTGGGGGTSTGYYGAFHDSTNQYANVATQAYTWNIGTTDASNGVNIINGNSIQFPYAGVYNIQFSTQMVNTGTGGANTANIWIRQNGVDVPSSSGEIQVPAKSSGVNGAIISSWNYVLPVNANDTVQFLWQQNSNDSSVYIASLPSATSPTRPSTPGIIITATQVTSVVNAYGNSNVATFLGSGFGSNTITTSGAITAGNLITTNGVFWANGAVYSTGSGTTYSNANVASYLPTYSGNIGGGGSGDLVLQAGNGNFFNKTVGFGNIYYQTAAGGYINFNGPTVATANIQVNSGSYFIGDGSKLTNIPTNYGNSNVAAFLSSGFGSNTITTTGNISAGYITGTLLTANQPNITTLGTQTNIYTTGLVSALNITATGYITASGVGTFGNVLTTNGVYWASNGAPYSTGGNYGNTQVAAYLLAPGPIGQTTPNSGSFAGLTATGATSLGNVTVTGNLTVNNQGTFANVASTNGYFWANGTAYSTSTGSATFFSGNLAGNILYDGVNNRIIANAYPLSTPTATWQGNVFTNQIAVKPVYTNSQLQPVSGSQTNQAISSIISANVAYQSRYGTQTTATNAINYIQVTPVTANTMNQADRVRGLQGIVEVNLNGIAWGVMAANAANVSTLVGTSGQTQIAGAANTAAAIGVLGAVTVIPVSGSANVQYATNFFGTTTYNNTNSPTASNIAYARMLGGSISSSGNLAIYNAVGLHTQTGWATATNKYVVLNEDTNSVIQTSGNVGVTGNIKMQAYQETVYATGSSGGTVSINVSNGTIQSLTLTQSITSLSFTGMPAGGSVSLIITQGGSGSYTLTTTGIKYAGGNSTLSTAVGAIDILNILYDGTTYYASLVNGYA